MALDRAEKSHDKRSNDFEEDIRRNKKARTSLEVDGEGSTMIAVMLSMKASLDAQTKVRTGYFQ